MGIEPVWGLTLLPLYPLFTVLDAFTVVAMSQSFQDNC